ncbi:hypothetical protein KP509_1Z290900 [Ceratopteris richardii]|nr:hypothetical protein KP509_1Z307000 [Ceratopteris richardii]KAH6554856.1 hypothetical protein KP509_1Z301600 [Ceratopteris richardii]KAH6554994.1 hypothetical protein KP509_1Z290900 [Ceratopteris richardii]
MASSPFEAGIFEYDSFALLPEIFPVNATILLLVHGVLFSTFKQYDYLLLVCNVGWLGALPHRVLITIAPVAAGAPIAFANLLYNNGMKDNSTYFREILPLLSTASTLVTCLEYFKRERLNAFESIVLILPSTRTLKRDSEFSTEAGLKYSISGAFSSGILLFGFCRPIRSMIYGSTGITNFEESAKTFTGYELTKLGAQSSGIFMGISFIAVGFLFKITAVSFRAAIGGAGNSCMKADYSTQPTNQPTNLVGYNERNEIPRHQTHRLYRRDPTAVSRLEFIGPLVPTQHSVPLRPLSHGINQARRELENQPGNGFIRHGKRRFGIGAGKQRGAEHAAFFPIAPKISIPANMLRVFFYISALRALAKTNPISAITLSVTMSSYAGIPPLAGFRSKFYLFFAALSCGAYLLAFIGIVTSVISLKIMYFDTPPRWILSNPMDPEKLLLPAISSSPISFLFFYLSPLFLVSKEMARCLCCI